MWSKMMSENKKKLDYGVVNKTSSQTKAVNSEDLCARLQTLKIPQ